ncbi:coatomer subunit beta-like, partial [Schistocerca gregaria]|uniref:coatomer subunit beta-like n=1 Tax=Schistocerca gregaria TaxID=7010 RepID=UPI00211DDFEB
MRDLKPSEQNIFEGANAALAVSAEGAGVGGTSVSRVLRRNAVLALYSVYCSIPELVPDLEELVSAYLDSESEPACKRNGYLVMFGACPRLAEKKVGVMEEVLEMEEPMQLLMLRAIRRCMDEGAERTKRGEEMRIEGDSWSTEGEGKWKRHVVFDDAGFIRRVSGLRLSLIRVTFMCLSPSMKQSAVKYEAAMTMLRSSRAPTAVKAACKALLQLVDELSDNNVRVMVVECLTGVAKTSKKVLSELVLDVLRLLWAQPVKLELVRRVLNLVVELVMPQNWQQVLSLLKKEIVKSQRKGFEQAEPYRKLIIHALNELVVRYPAIVTSVVMELLDLLGDKDVAGEVGMLVMEVASRYEDKREEILENMYKHMDQITTGAPLQLVLWIVGEYETREKWMKRCIQMCGRWLLGSEQMGRILERLS